MVNHLTKVHTIWTESHSLLKRFWYERTLQDDWAVVSHKVDSSGNGDFRSNSFQQAVVSRCRLIVDSLEECDKNEVVIWTDIDIQWFRSAEQDLLTLLEDVDLLYQRETTGEERVNAGLLVFKVSGPVIDTTRRWRDAFSDGGSGKLDQEVLDIVLQDSPIRRRPLPARYWHRYLGPMPDDVVMHHAIGTFPTEDKSSVQHKYEQLMEVRLEYEERKRGLG